MSVRRGELDLGFEQRLPRSHTMERLGPEDNFEDGSRIATILGAAAVVYEYDRARSDDLDIEPVCLFA